MGMCYNSCALTGLPIPKGAKVVLLFLAEEPHFRSRWSVVSLPIFIRADYWRMSSYFDPSGPSFRLLKKDPAWTLFKSFANINDSKEWFHLALNGKVLKPRVIMPWVCLRNVWDSILHSGLNNFDKQQTIDLACKLHGVISDASLTVLQGLNTPRMAIDTLFLQCVFPHISTDKEVCRRLRALSCVLWQCESCMGRALVPDTPGAPQSAFSEKQILEFHESLLSAMRRSMGFLK